MKKLIIKIIFFLTPLILIVGLYTYIDPFNLFTKNKIVYKQNCNRDYQSLELLIFNNKKYEAFILGNSRSFFYDTKYLNNKVKTNFFHLNASSESLFGVNGKLEYLDKKNYHLNNIIIVLDENLLSNIYNNQGYLVIKHPLISGESNFSFQTNMFKGFASSAIMAQLDFLFFNTFRPYMEKYGIKENLWEINLENNEIRRPSLDSMIKKNIKEYYKKMENEFYDRPINITYSNRVIYKNQEKLLLNIKNILNKHKSNFKIIINPLYDQRKINKSDLNKLYAIFGKTNVFDFSGINEITSNKYNYYESSHYLPKVANQIVNVIYK